MPGVSASYTGAIVRFTEYRTTVPADLYIVGDTVIIVRNQMDSFYNSHCNREVTHSVFIGSKGFANADKTFVAVPFDQFFNRITNIQTNEEDNG